MIPAALLLALAPIQEPPIGAPTGGLLVERWPVERLREVLSPREDWHPFPPAGEAGWGALPEVVRAAHLSAAGEWLGEPWPSLPASLFLDFARTGNRTRYQSLRSARRSRLAEEVLGEVLEGQGRFLDDVIDGIWLICEETYWGVPAHVHLQRAGNGLPDVSEPTVDLFAAETAALLAWTQHLLGARLDDVSPLVRPRIELEIERRILGPCRERTDFWWMGYGGRRVNNWNPWIVSNWLTAALLVERDPELRVADVAKAMEVLDHFIAGYPADGGCDEGPGYWSRAGGSLFDCLELLHSASGGAVDVFDQPLVGEMGRFIQRAHIAGDWFVNFADASPRVGIDAPLVFRYARAIGDEGLAGFAAEAARRQGLGQDRLRVGGLGRTLPALFSLRELLEVEPRPTLARDVWLGDLQVMVAREEQGSTRGFTVAAKGGHNDESHNHNDVGNVIVFHDGQPVLVDAGVGTYTAKTFSGQRYTIWTMQSAYHNLPTLNGVQQRPGRHRRARAVVHESDEERAELTLELEEAYPREAQVESFARRITLDRAGGRVVLSDRYRLAALGGPSTWNLLTPRRVEVEPGRLVLSLEGAAPVFLEVEPADLEVSVEELPLEDGRLARSWGRGLRRIVLSPASPARSGQVRVCLSR